jgi:hypothetical protein
MTRDPSEIRDVLVSSVQTLGERAEDIRGLIPDVWPAGATTVIDHLADSVQDARSRVSTLAKDSTQPLIESDRSALLSASKDRRMKAVGVLLVLSFVLLLRRRRQQRRRQSSER